ncbi:MAG: YqaA family protein [Actinomycetota bacterium]
MALTTPIRTRRSLLARLRYLAGSPTGPRLCFAWGFLEAFMFPIIPDFALAPLAFVAPRRAPILVAATVTGSISGGGIAFLLSLTAVGAVLLEHAWLVTDRMRESAGDWLRIEGVAGLAHQPLSGVPYKVFGLQAGAHTDLVPFLLVSALVRGARMIAVALIAGLVGADFGRFERALEAALPALMTLYALAFTIGMLVVLIGWTDFTFG